MIAARGVTAEIADAGQWRERAEAAEELLQHVEGRLTAAALRGREALAQAAAEAVQTIQALRKEAA